MFNNAELIKHMAFCYNLASESPDPSNQNGAIIVVRNPDGTLERIAKGYNHFYDGIPPEVENRDVKLQRIEHAERDAIFYAAARGHKCEGAIMICPWAACYDCARAIMGSGITALVYHKQRYLLTPERWKTAVDEALTWMSFDGMYLLELDASIPGTNPIYVNGELWSPATMELVA